MDTTDARDTPITAVADPCELAERPLRRRAILLFEAQRRRTSSCCRIVRGRQSCCCLLDRCAQRAPPDRHARRCRHHLGGVGWLVFDGVFFNALRIPTFLLGSGAAPLLNESALRAEYRQGLQTTYQMTPFERSTTKGRSLRDGVVEASQHLELSVSRPPVTFPAMAAFAQQTRLPAFVFNTTVRPPRPSASQPIGDRLMEFTPAGFGSDSCGYLTWEQTNEFGWERPASRLPPQESTANQHFSAERFRAYRALGEHYGRTAATRL